VHGFASSVGGAFAIPHGLLCATLLAEATGENIRQLELSGSGKAALEKYAVAGWLVSGREDLSLRDACRVLVETLETWQETFGIPRLGTYGIGAGDVQRLVSVTRSKSNPLHLSQESLKRILLARL